MKSGNVTSTTIDLSKTNLKSTSSTVDLSRTNPKEKEKDKGKKSTNAASKKISPYTAPSKGSGVGKVKSEAQGPIDWTHMGIKLKYRGEKQREDAWELWKSSIGNAKQLLDDFNEVLPVIKIERHPMYAMYFRRVREENNESNTRTKSRLLMKRFVLDVQELWLTNLQHLHEHQPGSMAVDDEDDSNEDYMRGKGLNKRRDVKEIANLQHQVQSVSQKRAFAQAYHTTRMPPPKVKLDYKPGSTPGLTPPKPVIPTIESILTSLPYWRIFQSDASYQYRDELVCNSTDSVALHIDRLLPSSDFATYISPEVVWRFTAMHSVSLAKRVFLIPESMIAVYAAQIMNADTSNNLQGPTDTALTVYKTNQTIALPYEDNTVEWEGGLEISLLSQPVPADIKGQDYPLRIAISATMEPVHHLQTQPPGSTYLTEAPLAAQSRPIMQFILQTSPAEVRTLLQNERMPLRTLDWWLQPERVLDTWEPLLQYVRLETNKDNAHNEHLSLGFTRQPVGLVLTADVSKAHRLLSEDMLTAIQAAACAYEVLPYLRLMADPNHTVPSLRFQHRGAEVAAPKLTEVASIDSTYPYDSIGIDRTLSSSAGYDWKAEAKQLFHSGRWEKLLEQGLNGSLLANGGISRIYQVPGASEIGRRGLWFPDAMDPTQEKTQVGAIFFRDANVSTTDSILITLTYLLDTAIKFPSETAWENFPQMPIPAIAEEANGVIPMRTIKPRALLQREPLVSPLEVRLSDVVTIFAAVAVEGIDYLPRNYELTLPQPQRPKGLRRYVPTKNRYGFREQVEVQLLDINPVVDAKVYGITKQGAVANNTGVNPRNIWHSLIAVNEHICRPRTSKDYHYIVANLVHCGANVPTSYATRMKAMEMVGLTSSAFKHFEDAYGKIKALRDVFSKQLALEAKIEKVTNDLKTKESMMVRQLQRKLQRQLEKKLKKSTKSEEGWKRRFAASSLVEVQGNWERRRDDRNGLLFFHRILPPSYPSSGMNRTEKYLDTCQWEVPAEWDGEFWKLPPNQNLGPAGFVNPGPQFLGSSADGLRSQNDTLASSQRYHTGDTVHMHGREFPNPQRNVPQHLQNIHVETAAAFQEPPSDWIPHPNTTVPSNNNNNINSSNVGLSFTQQINQSLERKLHPKNTRAVNDDDNWSELDSARADRSLADSLAPTIDTVNLEHIAEQLISSDEIMRVIAKRLGLSEQQIVPADELSSVFSTNSSQQQPPPHPTLPNHGNEPEDLALLAPRKHYDATLAQQQKLQALSHQSKGVMETEFDSDDDLWSDDDEEVGDFDVDKELASFDHLPQSQLEMAQMRRRDNNPHLEEESKLQKPGRNNKRKPPKDPASVPSQVPYLDLREVLGGETNAEIEANARTYNWRRLPRPEIRDNFLTQALKTHVKGPEATSCNTLNTPIFLMPIAPVDACHYVPEPFGVAIESLFIPDAKKDMERSIATLERNIKREEELSRNVPTDDLLLFGEAKEFTSVEMFLAKQYKADQAQVSDPMEAAQERAILAAKSSNIAIMEDCLAEDIPLNTADSFGNTLLILAAQQGSKRMVKFLLRRGANVNLQNLSGNTALHYCYAYGNGDLGDYLKQKGANDAIVNVDGLTCYEGLSREGLAEQFGDFEEDDYENAGQDG